MGQGVADALASAVALGLALAAGEAGGPGDPVALGLEEAAGEVELEGLGLRQNETVGAGPRMV